MTGWVDGNRITDWRRAIGELILLHQHIRDLDRHGIWEHDLPRLAAKPEEVAAAERRLAWTLPTPYRQFLAHADGWRAFYQWVDLFGTEDLVGRPAEAARSRIEELDRSGSLTQSGVESPDLFPIAMTRVGHGAVVPDIFVVARRPKNGEVVWLADEEVDRFADFDAFYLAMLDYNRKEIETLAAEAKREGRVV